MSRYSFKGLVIIAMAFLFVSCKQNPRFILMSSKQTGIDFSNDITEDKDFNVMRFEYIYNGAGAGIADFNGDGLQDIFFAGNQVSSKAYLNTGNFKFRDITSDFKGLTNDQWYSGVTIADVNGDNRPDVYLTSTGGRNPEMRKNRLWINEGPGKNGDPVFTEKAEQYGIADTSFSVNATFFDYDLDGDLDLYIINNTLNSRMNTNYRAKVLDGTAPNNDKLYRNNGNGTFTNITKEAGIIYEGFGLGLAVGDFNRDGYPDLYISNDFISNDLLYINQRDGTFKNEIRKYISYQSRSSMGNDMADINNDGFEDMYTMDMLPSSVWKKKQTINGHSYMMYINDEKYGFEKQYVRNMLHLNNGLLNDTLLPFSEAGRQLGIEDTEWSWSPLFADYDNDGDKDLLIANGFPVDETDKDWTRLKVEGEGSFASDETLISMAPALKIPNIAFENQGESGFVRKNDWLPQIPSYSYGAAFADFDNDGDLDYITNNLNGQAFILKNTTREKQGDKAAYLAVNLKGKGDNSEALGAKVEIWENGKYQFMEKFLTRGYASTVTPVLHFGLSGNNVIDSLKVTWPLHDRITLLKNVKADQMITIDENTTSSAFLKPLKNGTENYLFKSRPGILNYVHQQNDFLDFVLNQKIIPHKFSQIGPRMAKGDINGDGREDIIVGSGNLLPTTVFLRSNKGFEQVEIKGLSGKKDYSEADFAIADIDGDGKNDIIAIAGGYENRNENEYKHYAYFNRGGAFEATALPIPAFPASVVRPCDFNHDGKMDFFVGARVKKGMFPYSNHSWLIKNDNGRLFVDSLSKINLGMVTDALWTDYDGDGWEDLLVAREWNSLVLMRNINGQKLDPVFLPELENQQGIWYSLAAGDFDRDGDTDYIAGNLGDNTRYRPSDKYPLKLYAVDFDMDGNIDPLITGWWKDQEGKMTEYPFMYLDELWSQSAYFQAKFKDYTTYSSAGIDKIIDEGMKKRIEFQLQVNTTSSYVLWNDKGHFRWEKLPFEVQLSPVKKMIVADLNNDSYPDVIMGGNDYSWELGTGYLDSNKGLVLINRKEPANHSGSTFEIQGPAKSGMLLKGVVESMLWFDGDTSLLVAGFNRAPSKVFAHKKGE